MGSTQQSSAEYTQVYGVYPFISQSALSITTSTSPLILSVANPSESLFTKETTDPWTTGKIFLLLSCVDGLRNKERFTQNA